MKGQLSAEMLILIAVVLAVVAIVAIQILGSAKETSANVQNQTNKLNKITSESVKSDVGGYCFEDSDCVSDHCNIEVHKCES